MTTAGERTQWRPTGERGVGTEAWATAVVAAQLAAVGTRRGIPRCAARRMVILALPMDRATARELPEEFLQSGGTSIERALSLVLRHWGSYPPGHQRQLAQALVALLEPLLNAPPRTVPEALREECARVVALWEERWADTVANMATFTKAT